MDWGIFGICIYNYIYIYTYTYLYLSIICFHNSLDHLLECWHMWIYISLSHHSRAHTISILTIKLWNMYILILALTYMSRICFKRAIHHQAYDLIVKINAWILDYLSKFIDYTVEKNASCYYIPQINTMHSYLEENFENSMITWLCGISYPLSKLYIYTSHD